MSYETSRDSHAMRLALQLRAIEEPRCQEIAERLWGLAGSDNEVDLLSAMYAGKAILEAKAFAEAAHPRAAAGSATGGQFVSAGTSSTTTTSAATAGAESALGKKLTPENIRKYQQAHGLLVDGKIGSQTAAALLGEEGRKVKPGAMTHKQRLALELLAPIKPSAKPRPKHPAHPKPRPTGGAGLR